jgi:hypothetical protein
MYTSVVDTRKTHLDPRYHCPWALIVIKRIRLCCCIYGLIVHRSLYMFVLGASLMKMD